MTIAREYQRRDIPLALMVIDEGAWDLLGDEGWGGCAKGDETASGSKCPCWEDAGAMVQELKAMGVEVMLSPYLQFILPSSKNFAQAKARGALAVGVADTSGYADGAVGMADTPGYTDGAMGVADTPGYTDGKPACIAYSGYNDGNRDSGRCLNATGGAEHNPYCGHGCMYDVFDEGSGQLMM